MTVSVSSVASISQTMSVSGISVAESVSVSKSWSGGVADSGRRDGDLSQSGGGVGNLIYEKIKLNKGWCGFDSTLKKNI